MLLEHTVVHSSHSLVYLATLSRNFEGTFFGVFEAIWGVPGGHLVLVVVLVVVLVLVLVLQLVLVLVLVLLLSSRYSTDY